MNPHRSETPAEMKAASDIWNLLRHSVYLIRRGKAELVVLTAALALISLPAVLKVIGNTPSPVYTYLSRIQWLFPLLGFVAMAWSIYRALRFASIPPLTDQPDKPSAIKGPLSFGPEDADLFIRLGRGAEIRTLLGHVIDRSIPLTVVYGESGCGKTSLLRAGLTYALERHNSASKSDIEYLYIEALPDNPEVRLLQTVTSSWRTTGRKPRTLTELLRSSDCCERVIAIDQFEQLSPKDYPEFFEFLISAVKQTSPCRIRLIVAFSREYASTWLDIQQRLDGFYPPMLTLEQLTIGQATDVLAILADESGLTLSPELISRFLAQRSERGRISPVDIGIGLLVLSELARSQDRDHLSTEHYLGAGGEEGLLSSYIRQRLAHFPDSDRQAVYSLLLRLVQEDSNHRIAQGCTPEVLLSGNDSMSARLEQHITYLSSPHVRILEPIPPPPDVPTAYRLTHDRFAPAIRQLAGVMLAEAERASLLIDRRYRHWEAERRHSQFLLRGAELAEVLKHRLEIRLGECQQEKSEYLTRSLRARTSHRGLCAGVGVVLMAIAGCLIGGQQSEAYRRETVAWGLPAQLYEKRHQLESLTLETEITNFRWLPAHLKSISTPLGSHADLTSFPEGLRQLSIRSATTQWIDCANLPRNLKSFSAEGIELKNISLLPNLLELKLRYTGVIDLSKLPRTLKKLEFDGELVVNSDKMPSIEELSLDCHHRPVGIRVSQLPRTIRSLSAARDLFVVDAEFPPVQRLEIRSGWIVQSLSVGDIPRTVVELVVDELFPGIERLNQLTSLKLHRSETDGELSCLALPDSIQNLDVDNGVVSNLDKLHRLERLVGRISEQRLVRLPRSMRSLHLVSSSEAQEGKLGQSLLRELNLGCNENNPVFDGAFLPRSLRKFTLECMTRDCSTSFRNLPDLESLSLVDGGKTDQTALDLSGLPRSLKSLSVYRRRLLNLESIPDVHALELTGVGELDLSRIPRSVTSLTLEGPATRSLEHLPSAVKSLTITGKVYSHIGG